MLQDFQQDKVFQSCLSSPENDVVVKFLSGLNRDEDSETAYMETSSSGQIKHRVSGKQQNSACHFPIRNRER
jgi:hypothetical protein